ncbi:hypothetical protein F5B20DRAFT_248912 [Whalleya microplaca]|nr:hypothetical protein F5B20DRAFT_248912 [Whalleya microplaca]
MAPKSSAGSQLSPRDMEVLAKAWHCFETEPSINYQKLADVAGFKNVQSARACFLPIKKRLMSSAVDVSAENGGASTASAVSPTRATPTKTPRKRKADTDKTPSSVKKTKPAAIKQADDDNDDQEDLGNAKVKNDTAVVVKDEENNDDGEV